jgi:hypothetical protein
MDEPQGRTPNRHRSRGKSPDRAIALPQRLSAEVPPRHSGSIAHTDRAVIKIENRHPVRTTALLRRDALPVVRAALQRPVSDMDSPLAGLHRSPCRSRCKISPLGILWVTGPNGPFPSAAQPVKLVVSRLSGEGLFNERPVTQNRVRDVFVFAASAGKAWGPQATVSRSGATMFWCQP